MEQIQNEDEGLESEIVFPDESLGYADLSELFDQADFLAFHYGIGGCKSYSEFIRMVDKEDPIVISGLIDSANRRQIMMYGKRNVAPRVPPSNVGLKDSKSNKNSVATEQKVLLKFLSFMGAPKEEVNEALAKIRSGKIKVPKTDYSWITSEKLSSEKFDLQAVLAQMKEDEKNSINFKVSDRTRQSRLAKLKDNV